ncbi:LURP-one-related/scramblase family protein [Halospeciosus flavus]|uniref:LURP-one-related/scramblase family protein n=1 Tax=Halospeciosus flavus TaxID=3032283 RepID=A0ABD5Z5K5_9EURY|nr:hypothetical protein [Halospeciosus flavus]
MSDDGTDGEYDIAGIELTGDRYEVRQSLIRNKYAVRDAAGDVVLRGKQKMFKLKEEFPFVDGEGNDVFTVKAGGMLDVAGNYAIRDTTGEEVVVLDEDYSLFAENWTVRDPDTGEALATIRSTSKLVEVLRHFVGAVGLVPYKYEILDAEGDHVGHISGQFSLRDTYTVTIDDASDVPKEAVVAAAVVLDALRGG